MTYTPSTVAFGYVDNNGGSSTQTVTFTNTTGQTIDLLGQGGYSDGDGDEMLGMQCPDQDGASQPQVLAPGQSCTATLTLRWVNQVTDTTFSQTANNGGEATFAPTFGTIAVGASTSYQFYVPFTATIGPACGAGTDDGASSGTNCAASEAGGQPTQGCVQMSTNSVVGMAATADDQGYWITNDVGWIDACGDATINYGQLLVSSPPSSLIVGMATTANDQGYWLVAADGAVYAFGNAKNYGGMAGQALNKPIVGMAADPATGGYWLLGADGGVFSFNAPFYGSTGNIHLNKPVVGMAATSNGQGYWFVASDGGIFAYGNAGFHGSMGGTPLNRPVDGMAADYATGGYWLVASDGGIFAFDAPFYGSTGNLTLAEPIVGMEASPSDSGYRFVASDGGIFCFGSAGFYGSAA